MVTETEDLERFASLIMIAPFSPTIFPRTVDTLMCRTANSAPLCAGSMFHVEVCANEAEVARARTPRAKKTWRIQMSFRKAR
jgi:hypothetical protein